MVKVVHEYSPTLYTSPHKQGTHMTSGTYALVFVKQCLDIIHATHTLGFLPPLGQHIGAEAVATNYFVEQTIDMSAGILVQIESLNDTVPVYR